LAGDEGDAGLGEVEGIGQEGDEGFVGAAFYGWGGEGDFEGFGVYAGDGVFPCSGVDADGEGAAVGGVVGEGGGHGWCFRDDGGIVTARARATAGVLRFAQNDGVKQTTAKTTATADPPLREG
jgi:hypothetical protein